jgi:hypothetical protein
MTQPLIPETECWGSVEAVPVDQNCNLLSDSTGDVSGGLVQAGTLIRDEDSATSGPNSDDSGTTMLRRPRLASPLIRLPPGSLPLESVRVLQQWEGVVTEVADDSFFADLQDLNDSAEPIEVVELPFEEVPKDDRPLLQEGAVFYWSIGYETTAGGTLRRMSEIRLRRTPRWTKRAHRQAEQRAEELLERLANE